MLLGFFLLFFLMQNWRFNAFRFWYFFFPSFHSDLVFDLFFQIIKLIFELKIFLIEAIISSYYKGDYDKFWFFFLKENEIKRNQKTDKSSAILESLGIIYLCSLFIFDLNLLIWFARLFFFPKTKTTKN